MLVEKSSDRTYLFKWDQEIKKFNIEILIIPGACLYTYSARKFLNKLNKDHLKKLKQQVAVLWNHKIATAERKKTKV